MLRWVSHTITGSKLSQKESEIRPPKICQNSNFSAPAVMVVNSGVIIFLSEKNIIHGTYTYELNKKDIAFSRSSRASYTTWASIKAPSKKILKL